MSSIANAIKLYLMLQSRGKMKISEIAEILEVDERTVRRYKDELEQAYIYIDSQSGKYGGYYLRNDNYLMGLVLSHEEYLAIMMINEEIIRTNHVVLKDYNSAMQKIYSIYNNQNHETTKINLSNYTVKTSKSNINITEERKKLIDIHAAVLTRNKILLNYNSLNSGLSERVVHPYATIQYKGDLYFTGYCEKRQRISDFKLCRIVNYKILDDKFSKDSTFNLEEYMKNCIGIFKGQKINVKVKINYPMAQIVKEKVLVDNQKIIDKKEEGYIIYEAVMEGKEEIISWILSMGSYAKIIEPNFLQDEIKKEIEKIKNNY